MCSPTGCVARGMWLAESCGRTLLEPPMTAEDRCNLGRAPGPDARKEGDRVPDVTFRLRRGPEWVETSTARIFNGRKVIVFSLPGAFTPTCSSMHLPRYEELAPAFE